MASPQPSNAAAARVTTPSGLVVGIPEGSRLVFGRGPDADLTVEFAPVDNEGGVAVRRELLPLRRGVVGVEAKSCRVGALEEDHPGIWRSVGADRRQADGVGERHLRGCPCIPLGELLDRVLAQIRSPERWHVGAARHRRASLVRDGPSAPLRHHRGASRMARPGAISSVG